MLDWAGYMGKLFVRGGGGGGEGGSVPEQGTQASPAASLPHPLLSLASPAFPRVTRTLSHLVS